MKSVEELANELDSEKRFAEADLLMRLAIDFSVIPKDHPTQEGGFGIFQSNFPKHTKSELKNQLGQIPYDIGEEL